MDPKTPPIPLKPQEKHQPKRAGRIADVFLPPLISYPNRHPKNTLATSYSHEPISVIEHQDRKKRPYRVLHIGATPLMHACQQGDRARVLRLLKEQEETISYRDRTLRSALHYCMDAATGGAVAAAAPDLINAPDAEGHTPLHLAVIAGDTQLVAVLLANGADVNAKDLEGHSVLHWATVCGEAECVRLVLAAGAQPSTPDLRGGSPLHYAAQCCGAAATAELAVPKRVGLKVLQTLLDFGADVNAKDEDGRQPILWAASAGSVEAVLALARAGGVAAAGTSDKDGLTALHCAASRGHARCVEALVNLCGSQPDHVDDNGCSALHYAATLGHADATALILKLGADPNRQDRKGRTPALCAAAKGQLETLKILSQHGGSLHARTVRGTGIGHEAVASGRIELIKWLAKKRPSTLDVATHDGKTPLHVAALHGHLDVCKVLLDHRAKINAVLRTGKGNSMTPLDAALYRGHRDCAKLIQMHGGTTAQQLKTHRSTSNKVQKFQMKHTEESTASDSSPCRKHRHPELYYEERWVERRTRRKSNTGKLARRDSRSFSEEEVQLSKKSSRRDERRSRSESARKRSKRSSTRRKYEYSDSSVRSDSDDYSHDRGKSETIAHQQRMRKQQEKSKSKSANEEEVKSGPKKKDDDDRSVSDDSLEVVVVKKSLEKKCERTVSGKKSKAPRECTKETKLTKVHKRSSKKICRSSRSRTSDNDDNTTDHDESPDREKESVEEELAKRASRTSHEENEGDNEGIMESQYGKDATDSTSQETVKRVVVTAMVHKDQTPDTPKSTLETEGEAKLDDVTRKKMDQTGETSENVSFAERSKMELSDEVVSRGGPQLVVQENSRIDKETEDNSEKAKVMFTGEEDAQREEVKDKTQALKHVSGTSEENVKLPDSGDFILNEGAKVKETSPRDASSRKSSLRQSDVHETIDVSKDNIENLQVIREQKGEVSMKQESMKAGTEESFESIEDTELRKCETLNKHDSTESSEKIQEDEKQKMEALIEQSIDDKNLNDLVKEKSTGLLSTQSAALNSEESSSRKKELFRDKKSSVVERSNRARLEVEAEPTKARRPRSSAERRTRTGRSSTKASTKKHLFGSSDERFSDRDAIIAVIDNVEWNENEAIEKKIRTSLEEDMERVTEDEEGSEIGIVRVLPMSEEESSSKSPSLSAIRTPVINALPQVQSTISNRLVAIESPEGSHVERWRKQRRDSGGRDSGIEPSPRISRIPRVSNVRHCLSTIKQQNLNMETITRDVQISLRRYHLERKIFFQLMELKRLQIRHGKANEHVLVKRQVEAFHKSGMNGPTLGVVRYNRPLTFRQFEAFLYEQLRRLQGRPTTPDFCTEAKQCTQKTHRCHHATSAYTSVPVYTYLGGGIPDRVDHLPKIESRGRGQMTVEVTHGEEKQVIALPAERLNRTKRYFVTFTVKGETEDIEKPKSSCTIRRNAKSV